jgi:hypothetical protein
MKVEALDGRIHRVDRAVATTTPVLAFAISAFATIYRQLGVPKIQTVWAEDGPTFTACAYAQSLLSCVAEPYRGWIQLVPRVGAEIAVLAPPSIISVSLTLVAAAATGLVAAIVASAIRDASGSWVAGLATGASLVLVWQAAREISGNVTNLPWMLLAASIMVQFAWLAGHRLRVFDYGLVVAAGLSSPFAPVLLALAILGLVLRRPNAAALVASTAVSAAIQAYVGLTSPRTPPGELPFDLGQAIKVFVQFVVRDGPFGPIRVPPGWVVAAGVAVVCGIGVVRYLRGRARADDDAVGHADARDAFLVTLGIAAVGSATFFVTIYLQRAYNPRYTYMASALLVSALVFGAALLGRGAGSRHATRSRFDQGMWWAARLALPVAAFVLAVGFARSFRIETRSSNGPDVMAEYVAAAPNCDSGATSIRLPISPINADDWTIEIPCDRVVASP